MKKNLSILFVVLVSLSMILTACGGGGSSSSQSTNPQDIVGTWKMDGEDVTYEFAADGSFILNGVPGNAFGYDGAKLDITYVDGTSQVYTASINGDKMTWEFEGATTTLSRVK